MNEGPSFLGSSREDKGVRYAEVSRRADGRDGNRKCRGEVQMQRAKIASLEKPGAQRGTHSVPGKLTAARTVHLNAQLRH